MIALNLNKKENNKGHKSIKQKTNRKKLTKTKIDYLKRLINSQISSKINQERREKSAINIKNESK